MDSLRVLHVTEAYGGGVTSAINSYVHSSNQYEHHIFALVRADDKTGEEGEAEYSSVHLSSNRWQCLLMLREIVRTLNPSVIHLHSTYAGVICRLLPFIDPKKVVYTPHGFAFDRLDFWLLRKMYFLIERTLSYRTAVIAGCGKSEMLSARKYLKPKRAHEIINISGSLPQSNRVIPITGLPIIAMIGRVSEQKGYRYFSSLSKELSGVANFLWIGGGDVKACRHLTDSGVVVTGWLSRNEVLIKLSAISLYFHSAAWEGFPVSVLEAAEMDIPILLRNIPAFSDEALFVLASESDAVVALKAWCAADQLLRSKAIVVSREIKRYHSKANQARSLKSLYESFSSE